MWQKSLQFQFRLATSRTTVFNNNIGQGDPGSLNSIFANQFKCGTLVKLRVFILKVVTLSPHLTFWWTYCNSQSKIYHIAQCQGSRAPMVRHFLVFMCIRQNDIAKISKVPGASRNVNSARAITWLVVVTTMVHFWITVHLHLASFYATKYFRKKIAKGNVYWTKYWIGIERAWLPGRTSPPRWYIYSYNWLFSR